ncbi:MAG: glycogen-debranching protein [Fusobacteriaceae bacterium]|nr:glycogen-debranching protein [Fusobacteriaceae bacterium]
MDFIKNGYPKLGSTVEDNGINFSIYAKDKNRIILNLYYNDIDIIPSKSYRLDPKINKTQDVWHIFIEELTEGIMYTWTIDDSPEILDPFSLAYTGNKLYTKKKNIAVKTAKNPTSHLNIPWEDTIIYEAHIKFFTKNGNSNVILPGTYHGFREKIPYLKELGITAVEFLPIFEWDDQINQKNPLSGEPLKNIWGYNPIGFFAITKQFSNSKISSSFDEIKEFKNLVKELHDNNIEVIIDVVYNHTAEGGKNGPIYNFKAMNHDSFYIMDEDKKEYKNYSGCGNTFICNGKLSKQIIIESLYYWYDSIGIDGFRFDLAPIMGRDEIGQWLSPSILDDIACDPILKNAKLISESWDIEGYFLGDMPNNWSEWNGKYRDVVRRFIKGDFELVPELLKRIFGSPDLFKRDNRNPTSSINFITSHDGFTMLDLVSYNSKHNLNNGENNNDGENQNFSSNWGEEGLTNNPNLRALRKKLIKNMFLILLISQGVPMIRMGDELGHTQFGNNNPYCQDNLSTWINWERGHSDFYDIYQFVKNMINLRKKYKIFRKADYLQLELLDENIESDSFDVALHGVNLNTPDYSKNSLSIAFTLFDRDSDTRFHIALNSYHSHLTFALPQTQPEKHWRIFVDTAIERDTDFTENGEIIANDYSLASNSCLILISK